MNPSQFYDLLAQVRIVPVLVLPQADGAFDLGAALVAGGIPIAEVTFRTDAAEAAIAAMSTVDGLVVGAGTVTTADQVDRAAKAGARFVVSPGISESVVRRCRELDIQVLPGVATATDIMTALDLGVDVVKFFPAEIAGGLPAIRALAGPFPAVRFVPTGGITAMSALDYLAHPSVLAVGGSWMAPAEVIGRSDWGMARDLAAETIGIIAAGVDDAVAAR